LPARILWALQIEIDLYYKVEAVSKCFPLTAGFKVKEGDPAMAELTTGIHCVFRGL
jgi:hypothetical protein